MILLQYLLPHHYINKLAKMLGRCSISWVKKLLIKSFLSRYKVNLDEAIHSDPMSYRSYNDFFTRKLLPEARTIQADKATIISPCDGYITQYGNIPEDTIITAKGSKLSLKNLLAVTGSIENHINIEEFINGKFVNIYLAPHNYHRIHIPCSAMLEYMIYVPGKLFSVSPKIAQKIPDVFSYNERVICVFNSDIGKFILVMIGAMIVGSIVTSWHGEVNHNLQTRDVTLWDYREKKLTFNLGEELGYFQLGSTVIGFFANQQAIFAPNVTANTAIQMGQKLLQLSKYYITHDEAP